MTATTGSPNAGDERHEGEPSALDRIADVASELGADRIRDEARALAARVADGRYYVACIGQFKRGKSTLLNALLGAPILPTGIVPVTAIPTVVRYGPAPSASVRIQGDEMWQSVSIDALADYVSEERNPNNQLGVDAVQVFAPVPLLAAGMCLVDTPGVGSVHEQNSRVTFAFVPHVDAAIIVIGVDPPLGGEELALIEAIAKGVPDAIVVLNKADRFSDTERAEASRFAQKVLAARLHREIPKPFHVSAAKQLTEPDARWDWTSFIASLEELQSCSSRRLVEGALDRGMKRLLEQTRWMLREQRQALLRPLHETKQRVTLLKGFANDAQREARTLAPLFDAEQRALTETFAERCERFLAEAMPAAHHKLEAAIANMGGLFGPKLREQAFAATREIARDLVEPWLAEQQAAAAAAYREIAQRFVSIGETHLENVWAQDGPGLELTAITLRANVELRAPSRYYFRVVHVLAASSPLQRLADAFRAGRALRRSVARAATAYLDDLLRMNCTLVANDIEERVLESRRRLEAEIHSALGEAAVSAQRALAQASEAHALGAESVTKSLARLDRLEATLATIRR